MKKSPFNNLIIRTAAVIDRHCGFIYACDPKRERRGEPHSEIFLWKDGNIDQGECNYDAHTICLIDQPERGIVDVSEAGYYTADTDSNSVTQDLFVNSLPPPASRRVRGLRSVREISGYAHAIGIRGMIYRLDVIDRWTRIDEGIPSSFDGQAIHGYGLSDLIAVGFGGQIWHYDGKQWRQEDTATNQNLSAVVCAPDGTVYVGGHNGTLLRGQPGQWSIILQTDLDDDIWDLEWFAGRLFVSTLDGLFTLRGDRLDQVSYGKYTPRSTYQLSAHGDVMWSNGETDIMEFDGTSWTRIV